MERCEAGGLEVPVEVRGSSAETLVFLPGLGCHPGYYRPGLERLAERFRVLVPDLSYRTRRGARTGPLPASPRDYLDLLERTVGRMAPDAPWVGHSFGALLALLRPGPAIACAPSIPARIGWGRTILRAVWLQAREYLGFEGWRGVGYAPRIMVDYVATALLRPASLFPAVRALHADPESFPIVSRRGVFFLCRRDEMYRRAEYRRYLDAHAHDGITVVEVDDWHDWPITRPRRLGERVGEAYDRLMRHDSGARQTAPR